MVLTFKNCFNIELLALQSVRKFAQKVYIHNCSKVWNQIFCCLSEINYLIQQGLIKSDSKNIQNDTRFLFQITAFERQHILKKLSVKKNIKNYFNIDNNKCFLFKLSY